MKIFYKTVSIIITISILLCSCQFNKNEKVLEQIKNNLNSNNFNQCQIIVDNLNDDDKKSMEMLICNEVINKFENMISEEKIDLYNIFDISLIRSDFADSCRNLWNIISDFNINRKIENYNLFIYLRYFSLLSDVIQYSEIYSLIKYINNSKCLKLLDESIYKFHNNYNDFDFKNLKKYFKDLDYSKFNPEKPMVKDFINEQNNIYENLNSLILAIKKSDSDTVGISMSQIKASMEKQLYVYDTVVLIHSQLHSLFDDLSKNKNINKNYDLNINVEKRQYNPGTGFNLDYILKNDNNSINENQTNNNNEVESTNISVSKEDTLNLVIKSLKKLKENTANIIVQHTVTNNNVLVKFNTEQEIPETSNIIKHNIIKELDMTNQPSTQELEFANGTSSDLPLSQFIPPSNNDCILNIDAIDKFDVINGSSGSIIKLTLRSNTTSNSQPNCEISSFVNEYKVENDKITSYKIIYEPTTIEYTIDSDGNINKIDYILLGSGYYEFNSNDTNEKCTTTISFNTHCSYKITY